MSKQKKARNKAYKPRAYDTAGGLPMICRTSVSRVDVDEEYAGKLELIALTALDVIVRGIGTRRDWDCLAKCLNQAWTLASNEIGPEAMDSLVKAQEGMKRMANKFRDTQRMDLDTEGLDAIRSALIVWGQQLRISTIGEVDAATRIVEQHYGSHQA